MFENYFEEKIFQLEKVSDEYNKFKPYVEKVILMIRNYKREWRKNHDEKMSR
jgi:hypothetical protein